MAKEKKSKVKEINIKISNKAYDELAHMKVELKVETIPEAIRNAIILQRYLLEEVKKGRQIIIRDESNRREKQLLSLKVN